MERLRLIINPGTGAWPPPGIRAASEGEGRIFQAAKRIMLTEACVKPPTVARPAVSWRETVDHVLRRAAS